MFKDYMNILSYEDKNDELINALREELKNKSKEEIIEVYLSLYKKL